MSFQYATENHPRLKNPRQTDAHLKAETAHLNPRNKDDMFIIQPKFSIRNTRPKITTLHRFTTLLLSLVSQTLNRGWIISMSPL